MDTPLIKEETGGIHGASGSGFSRATLIHRRKQPQSRSEAITYGTQYQRAAALVDLAEDGIGLPEEVLDDPRFEKAAKFYFMYIKFDIIWSLNLLALLILNFLEKPLWCLESDGNPCQNRDYYFLGQLPYLTNVESLVYEGITLLILAIYTFFPISYEGSRLYWKNYSNIIKVILLTILALDLLVYILFMTPVPFSFLPLRVAPYIRIFFIALNVRELKSCIITLAGMMRTYVWILALWLLFLVFSSWLAFVTFEDTIQGKTIFTSFGTTLYQMFVLFTTSNNPDVWIPAYKKSRWSCLFFVLYILLGVYFVTNLILAVVYDSFKIQLARQVGDMDSMRNRTLKKAFSIIDTHNHGFLNKDECICLFEELNNYRSLPKTSHEDFELIFRELDDSGDFKINMKEFADLCNAIALKFQKEPSPSWFEYYPSFYHSAPCKSLKDFVRSATFGYVVAFVLVLNLILVVIETTLDIQNSSGQEFWQKVEFFFGWIYVLEMALKIFSMGFSSYWMEGQNQFDFVITWIIVIGETATFCFPQWLPFLSNGEWIRYLLIARMLRLIRLLMHVPQYRGFLATFFALIPSLMPYLGMIFCIMCVYCTLGLQIFGGIVNAGNPKLEATDLSDNDYLLFNFNDYPNGMVTLFNLLVMGNWQVWMQSYKELTGTYWSLAYFISFYLITVLLLLNLILAFVLEAFFAEMDMEKDTCENYEDEPEIERRRRRIGIKSRSRIVDNLLHRILSNELGESESSKD